MAVKAADAAQDQAVVEADRMQASASLGLDPRTAPMAKHIEFGSGETAIEAIGRRRGQLSEEAKTRLSIIANIERRLAMQTIQPATVLNMNFFPLRVNSVLYDDLVPPACPEGLPWSKFVIDEHTLHGHKCKFDWADKGDQNYLPVELVPIVLAREFESYFWKMGGVVVYEGDADPSRDPQLIEKLKDAKQRMIDTAFEYFNEAQGQYLLPNKAGIGNIGQNHRKYAAFLLRERLIDSKPEWLSVRREESDLATPCPRCKAEPKKGAYMCPACGYILDAKQAFLDGEIDGDNVAMRRLGRSVLEELGITREQVPETTEERAAKMKKAAKKAAAAQQ